MLFIDNCRQISYAFSLLCAKTSTKAQWSHDFSAVEMAVICRAVRDFVSWGKEMKMKINVTFFQVLNDCFVDDVFYSSSTIRCGMPPTKFPLNLVVLY